MKRSLIEQRWRAYAAVLSEADKRDGGRERAFFLGAYETIRIMLDLGDEDVSVETAMEVIDAVRTECEDFFLISSRTNP